MMTSGGSVSTRSSSQAAEVRHLNIQKQHIDAVAFTEKSQAGNAIRQGGLEF